MSTISLNDHKQKKKYEKLVNDISEIINVILLTQRALAPFKNYLPVQEVISVLETNKILLELKQKRYKRELKKVQKDV
jgi:hypothetical protein